MKITELKVGKHGILKWCTIKLANRQIFPKGSQILGIIGANGSGKTTLCSMIARTFQSIYTRSELDFDISIKFEYHHSIRCIECIDGNIKLFIDEELYYEFELGSRFNKAQRDNHNGKVSSFWNGKIILSTFETNGEYPNKKPFNYKGIDPLMKYDLAGLYGATSYGYPSITNGIIRFLKNTSKQNIANIFLEQMGFQLSRRIDMKIVSNIADHEPYLDRENQEALSYDFTKSRHYSPEKVTAARRKLSEIRLYEMLSEDTRLELTSKTQSLQFSDVLSISEDYSEYIGKYIFLNGLELIKDSVTLSFKELSSGEKFLIMRYISILSGIEKNSIVIIEEPENHLNPKWRELIIPALHKAATEYNSLLIFTTHDHRIIRYLHNSSVLNISRGAISKMAIPTLLCDEFDFESIGEPTIPFIYKDLKEAYDEMSREEQAELLNSMCDVEEKMLLRKIFLGNHETN